MERKIDPQTITGSKTQHLNHSVCPPSARWFSQIARTGAPFLLLFAAACAPQPQVTPTSTSTFAATAAPPATFTPPESSPTPTPTQMGSLSPDGPWLLLNTTQGLWASNPDGSGATLLTPGRILVPGPFAEAVSPDGANIAYLTSTDFTEPYGNYPNLKINILDLSRREPLVSLPLTSPETEPGNQNPSDIIRAMVERKSFAWSPEGDRLAYIGAAQGPSADLYEYQMGTRVTLRLTDGPDQAYYPLWSPDGKWIVQTAAAGFGTGAGITVTGIYAARADGSGVISLYDVSNNSGGEYGIGWLNANTLVTNSWFITCGPSDVRLADLSAQKADLAFEGCLSAAAVAPGRGTLLFAQSPDTASYDEHPQPGLFLITGQERSSRLISNANIREIVWSEGNNSFLAIGTDNRIYEISPSGDIRILTDKEPQIPTVSPDGRYWALSDSFYPNSLSGVWVGDYGQALRLIFPDKIAPGQILFSPAGDALYFLDTGGNLYRAQAPDWSPAILAANLQSAAPDLSLAWTENNHMVFS